MADVADVAAPEPEGSRNSKAVITMTKVRMVILMGIGNMITWRSGKRMAQAIRIPKMAPEAPIVGMSEGCVPRKREWYSR